MKIDITDNILSLIDKTPDEMMCSIAQRVRERRLEKNLTQMTLASRAGLTLASYRRFETTGEISLKSLIMIALALDMASEFDMLFSNPTYQNIDQLLNLAHKPRRKRGARNG
jgi:transcriptional regulator with XRE-family HTH domain